MEDRYLFMFDLGNVVLSNIETTDKIANYYHLDTKEFEQDYAHYVYPLMDGTIDAALYFSHASRQFNVQIAADSLSQFFSPSVNEEVLEAIQRIKSKGHTVVCASNTYKDHYEIVKEMGVLRLFDHCFVSHEMGLCKPAKQFFEFILDETEFDTKYSFFIDDLEENINSSQALGITSIWYKDDLSLKAIDKLNNLLGKLGI